MCGRYTLHANKKALADAIALALPEDYKPNYNIGPGRETLGIVTREKVQVASTMMHWGLRTPQNFHINARIETADTAPRFLSFKSENLIVSGRIDTLVRAGRSSCC